MINCCFYGAQNLYSRNDVLFSASEINTKTKRLSLSLYMEALYRLKCMKISVGIYKNEPLRITYSLRDAYHFFQYNAANCPM